MSIYLHLYDLKQCKKIRYKINIHDVCRNYTTTTNNNNDNNNQQIKDQQINDKTIFFTT